MLNTKTKITIFFLVFITFSFFAQITVKAQSAISISVSPPLFEAVIKPGKEVSQIYTITNNGGDTIITPKIKYFEPEDTIGGVNITEDDAPEWVKYNSEPFNLKFGDVKQFTVLISPPEEAEEVDHFLTLVFESTTPTDILGQNASFYKTQIGTNILISVSKDGNLKKSAQIVKFSAPFILDSRKTIKYSVNILNNGNSFWKPIGKITVNDQTLKLAEQNVLSGHSRDISCVQSEVLSDCEIKNKFLIGKYISRLEFTIDEDPKVYSSEIITYIFPFTYILIALLLLTLIRFRRIFNVWVKRK